VNSVLFYCIVSTKQHIKMGYAGCLVPRKIVTDVHGWAHKVFFDQTKACHIKKDCCLCPEIPGML
jgi:hypothetical protein